MSSDRNETFEASQKVFSHAESFAGVIFARAYLSRQLDKIVLVSCANSGPEGVGYETDWQRVVPYDASSVTLGGLVFEALTLYRVETCDFRTYKQSDWPAFRASGMKAVSRFESEFTMVEIRTRRPRLFFLNGTPIGAGSFTVTYRLGQSHCDEIGDRIRQVAVCCNALRDADLL